MNMNSKGVQAENNPNIITYNTTIAVSYNIKSILCARKFRIKGKKWHWDDIQEEKEKIVSFSQIEYMHKYVAG